MTPRFPEIAVFLPSFNGGGAERAMILFANTLVRHDFPVTLVCCEKKGPLVDLIDRRVRLVNLQAPRMLRAVLKLRKYIRTEKPDVVYATIVHANLALVLATRFLNPRPRIILRESNAPISEIKRTLSRKISHLLVPLLYPLADKVIAVSRKVRDEIVKLAPGLASRIEVLATPVVGEDVISCAAESPDHPWLQEGQPPVIIGVGRLHPQKNFRLLLEAFAQVRKSHQCRLIILGQGPLKEEILAHARSLNVDEDLSLPGFVLNPFPFMKRAAVFVLSSNYEGMPNVLIQAMALGTPVVATDCPGGNAECLQGGTLGALVPVNDTDAMAAAIKNALTLPVQDKTADLMVRTFGALPASQAYLACAGVTMHAGQVN